MPKSRPTERRTVGKRAKRTRQTKGARPKSGVMRRVSLMCPRCRRRRTPTGARRARNRRAESTRRATAQTPKSDEMRRVYLPCPR
eukprot:12938313-Alexandrium_andersonii.AAC.1